MFCLDVYTVVNIYTDQLITLTVKTINRIMFCYYEWEICVDCWGYVIGYGHLATFHVCILYIPNGRVVVYYINTKWSCCRVLYIPNGRVVVYYIYQMVVLSCTIYTKWSCTIYTEWSCCRVLYMPNGRVLYIPNGRVLYIPNGRVLYIPNGRVVVYYICRMVVYYI